MCVLWVDPGDMRTQMHQDAPGRGHLRPPDAREPGPRPGAPRRRAAPSGRYRVEDLLQRADLAGEELVGQ